MLRKDREGFLGSSGVGVDLIYYFFEYDVVNVVLWSVIESFCVFRRIEFAEYCQYLLLRER